MGKQGAGTHAHMTCEAVVRPVSSRERGEYEELAPGRPYKPPQLYSCTEKGESVPGTKAVAAPKSAIPT